MMHSIKRHTIGRFDAKNEPVNNEFESYKSNLENVEKALLTALKEIATAEASWTIVVSNMEKFSSTIYSVYPEEDDIKTLFKSTTDDVVQKLATEMANFTKPDSKVKNIERMIRAYIAEIEILSSEYKKVDTARKDYSMYLAKTEKLSNKGSEDDKMSRNLDKKENAKATYDSILDGTVHRMKTTYDKSAKMFKAAYVAHWLYHDSMSKLLDAKADGIPFAYAKSNSDSLLM